MNRFDRSVSVFYNRWKRCLLLSPTSPNSRGHPIPKKKGSHLLAIDVGNTSTAFGLFPLSSSKIKPSKSWRAPTPLLSSPSDFRSWLRRQQRKLKFSEGSTSVIISSVVPALNKKLKASIKSVLKTSPQFVTARTSSQIRIRTKKPMEVGPDRLVNARAALALTKSPAIIVDFGTATTFDCVSARKEYLGGVITPGPAISAEALYKRTARLPLVYLTKPTKPLGQTTLECIESGLYHGYRGLVEGVVRELRKRLGAGTRVFATGGQAKWILKGVKGVHRFVPDLTLMGLALTWHDGKRAKI